MAAQVAPLLEVPNLYSNHPAFRCARFSLQQLGADYLIPSNAANPETGISKLARQIREGEARWGPLRRIRLVVACADFPMGYTAVHEPFLWLQLVTPPAWIECGNVFNRSHTTGTTYVKARRCSKRIREGQDLSCVYCGRALCHTCASRHPAGGGPVCTRCSQLVGAYLERK